MIQNIYNLLDSELFRDKIEMYIGDRTLSSLANFLNGAFFTLKLYEINRDNHEPDFDKFHDWVAEYYNWKESTSGWKNIILKESNNDEKSAIDEFFKIYDKFKSFTKDVK